MTRLPVVSGDACIRALTKLGYLPVRTRGSHIRLVSKGRKPVTVPRHHELGHGLLRKIIASAGISVDEFNSLLKD